ncbi:hypothetical protein K9M47_00225 [Candidatus Gracilibacteria bacterium]|nr:hypothetical protein [Candidatus Gracilibacteria bacterium]MCF7898707.1 hypothetical protein [Candidatus Paceibacterota bacterium]
MKSEEKIFLVLERIKSKVDIAPSGSAINYRAGEEVKELGAEDEILILNKLAEEGVINVVSNYASDYI